MKVSTRRPRKSIPKNVVVQLFQSQPEYGDPVRHGFKTTTWYGAIAAGNRRTSQLLTNCAIISKKTGQPWHYPYDATIKVLEQLTIEQHRKLWADLSAKLKALDCVLTWDREVSTKNLLDYHLTFRSAPEDLMKNKGRKLKALLRAVTKVKLNIQVRTIPNFAACMNWCNYVTKAKRGGFSKRQRPNMATDDIDVIVNTTDAKPSADIYAKKRILFVKNTGLQKNNDIGDFWEQTKTQMKADFDQRKEAKKKQTTQNPFIDTAAKALSEITDLHEAFIARQLHAEVEAEQDPQKKADIRKHNRELADAFLKSTPEYEQETRYEAEQHQKHARQAKLNKDIDTLTPRTPFNPDACESFQATY